MDREAVIIDTNLLDDLSAKASSSERLRMNFNFHMNPESLSQRLLNSLEPGTKIPLHKHDHTPETYILIRGSLRIDFYENENVFQRSVVLDQKEGTYGIDIPAKQWHTVEILEKGTVIFEAKDGPYIPIT